MQYKYISIKEVEQAQTDLEVRQNIIIALIPLVRYIARKYRYHSLYEEMVQEGIFGIDDAINTFQNGYLMRFSAFAYDRIKYRIDNFYMKEAKAPLPVELFEQKSEESYIDIEQRIDLEKALTTLSDDRKDIVLYNSNGFSLEEITQGIMDSDYCSEHTRLERHRALEKLRTNMIETVHISYDPVNSQILGKLPEKVVKDLYDQLSFYPQGYEFSDKFIAGKWDGVKRLFSEKTYKFRSGLLARVCNILQSHQINYSIETSPFPNPLRQFASPINYLPQLRDYQREAVKAALDFKRGGINLPPRTGKTIIAAGIAHALEKYPVVFLVFSIEIALQTKIKFEKFLQQEIGFIGNGVCNIQDITVCSVMSVLSAYGVKYDFARLIEEENVVEEKNKIRQLLESAKVTICDEYHHYACKSADYILSKIKSAEYIIGLSATPWRTYEDESILLERNIGPVVFSKSYSEMIQKGFLLPPHIYIYKLPKVKAEHKYYPSIYREHIVENNLRNHVIGKAVKSLTANNKSVLILISQIKHGEILNLMIPQAIMLTGKEDKSYVQETIQKLERKEILVVITTLLGEGADLPNLDAVIIAEGGKSTIDVFQRMRSITPNGVKTHGVVIDFYDNVKYLSRHSKQRLNLYQSEEAFKIFQREVIVEGNHIKLKY